MLIFRGVSDIHSQLVSSTSYPFNLRFPPVWLLIVYRDFRTNLEVQEVSNLQHPISLPPRQLIFQDPSKKVPYDSHCPAACLWCFRNLRSIIHKFVIIVVVIIHSSKTWWHVQILNNIIKYICVYIYIYTQWICFLKHKLDPPKHFHKTHFHKNYPAWLFTGSSTTCEDFQKCSCGCKRCAKRMVSCFKHQTLHIHI